MPDNIGQMFYYGEIPWHRKGIALKQPATADEAIINGGLGWEVELFPIVTWESPASPITKRVAVVRRDRPAGHAGRVLGVVHSGFRPLQNRAGIEIFDSLIGKGKANYHTGGYLGNGEVTWLLAKLPAEIKIDKDDILHPYMLFTNSHDGSIAVDFRLTTVRVVCQNTLSLALETKKRSAVFKHSHQGNYRLLKEQAEEFFKFTLERVKRLGDEFQVMSNTQFQANSINEFVNKLLPVPSPPSGDRATDLALKQYQTRVANIKLVHDGIDSIFKNGFTNSLVIPPARETVWGMLNSVTAFVDHAQEIKGDRYAHSMFGKGAALKSSAYKLAMGYVSGLN